jgi:hypothetical protein
LSLCDFRSWAFGAAAPAQEVGRIWRADFDIDIAGKLLDGPMIYGECKWWKDRVGENILDQLIERASLTYYGPDSRKRQFILYPSATSQPEVVLFTPQSMLRGAGKRAQTEAPSHGACIKLRLSLEGPIRTEGGLIEPVNAEWSVLSGTKIISISDPRGSVRARKSERLTPPDAACPPGSSDAVRCVTNVRCCGL